ncbi:MarR family winged helix-turn-helix transcriptional regulator [Streptomyces genisteinicus]|uniref:MarR family transcriptional regulator n=1 Tax=Streptomyces genisteinicus TaxID=2768068 RepID=A0A7H0HMF9_9ACTN|nr:MarR family transcriptional regulator [Streptomyces genisteinicus]QNP61725.1 MarR family transcriptional regulator [Streptomyces genisteinicus]
MDANSTAPDSGSEATAEAARELIELLEVLWERGKDMVSPAPVSASQLRVLYCLDRDDGINLRTLGQVLGSAPPSVSRLCDRLEALGFVRRQPSQVSRRELELRLTSRGRAYLRDLRSQRQEALLEVIAAMPPSARSALLRGLTSFQEAVDDAGTLPRRPVAVKGARSA